MQVEHPHADRDASPAAVTVGQTTYAVDDAGVIQCPSDEAASVADVLARAYDISPDGLLIGVDDAATATCDAVKNDGEVCGRELPCPYHGDDEQVADAED